MACLEYPLCKYAHYENGSLVCASGKPCTYQRYCSSLLKVIHTSAYKKCEELKSMSKKKKNIEKPFETSNQMIATQETNNIIEKSEMCKARYSDGLIHINFKGYGLVLPNDKRHNEPVLEVLYVGEIGKRNFKFRIK